MFLPDVLAGRVVAIAGPAGPLTEAVASDAARAGAGLALCGQDTDSLDEMAWELIERHDTEVEIVPWTGDDPGRPLRTALAGAGFAAPALVLMGLTGWSAEAAAAWADAGPVVVVVEDIGSGPEAAPVATENLLCIPEDADPGVVGAWAVFLLAPPGQGVEAHVIRLIGRDGQPPAAA